MTIGLVGCDACDEDNHDFTVNFLGTGHGTVTIFSNGGTSLCAGNCTVKIVDEADVDLEAGPLAGSTFGSLCGAFGTTYTETHLHADFVCSVVFHATPTVSSVTATPAVPAPGQNFDLGIDGVPFDPDYAEIVITGPACASPCVINNANLTTKTASRVGKNPQLLATAGIYNVGVRNSASGALSNTKPLTIAPVGTQAILIGPITCVPAAPVCEPPYTQAFATHTVFKITYQSPTNHCGTIQLEVRTDGQLRLTTPDIAPNSSTAEIDLSGFLAGNPANPLLSLKAKGVFKPGQCLGADGTMTGWTGTLLVTTN